SPDGRRAVTVHNRSLRFLYDNRIKPIAFLHDLDRGTRRRVLTDPKLNVAALRWAPDGKGFFAADERSSRPDLPAAALTGLFHHDWPTGPGPRGPVGWPAALGPPPAPAVASPRAGFLALRAAGPRHRPARFTRAGQGWKRAWLTGAHSSHLFALACSADGKR